MLVTEGNSRTVPRAAAAGVSEGPNTVTFTTTYHELTFVDIGSGISVATPEWDGIALVLTRAKVEKLEALCRSVLSRP